MSAHTHHTRMRAVSLIAFAVVAFLGLSQNATAQSSKIGYINEDKVMDSYDAYLKAKEQYQAQHRAWESEYTRMQSAYVEDSLEFQKQKLILSAERKVERQAEINAKRTAAESYGKDIFGPGGQAERENNKLMKPLIDNLTAAIAKVAQEGNYDVVFSAQSLAYVNPALDLTQKVIDALAEEG
ncbi:MAG: OmpH family outer membrane protein [Candidatus Zixiibacteriota bacterium]